MGVRFSQRQVVERALHLLKLVEVECKAGVPRVTVLGDSQFEEASPLVVVVEGYSKWMGASGSWKGGAQRRPAGVPVSRLPASRLPTALAPPLPSSALFSLFDLLQQWHRLSVGTWSPSSSPTHLSEASPLSEPSLSLPSESFYGLPPMFSVLQPYSLFCAPSHPP